MAPGLKHDCGTNFDDLARELEHLAENQRLRSLVPRSADGVYLVGQDGRRLLNFGGNDYLGLAAERCESAVHTGSGASPLICGWTDAHEQLARTIAEFEQTESAVLFPCGYSACSGTVATLAAQGDLILSDQLNHASLIDGCRLSRAERKIYPHRDVDFVAAVLKERRDRYQRVWIVTDGVFGMDGSLAPLNSLCDVAEQYDATVVVDEAHGTGVLGEGGRGACEALSVSDRVPIRIGTMSKAIGAQGGFVAGPKVVIDYLINRCRTLIYSTSLAPAVARAASDGFSAIENQPERRLRVQSLSRLLRERLAVDSGPEEQGVPIVPSIVGDDQEVVRISAAMARLGIYVPAIRPPTVPEGTARLRISVSAAHDPAMVERLVDSIAESR